MSSMVETLEIYSYVRHQKKQKSLSSWSKAQIQSKPTAAGKMSGA